MSEQIIEGVKTESGEPVYVGRWYLAREKTKGQVFLGKFNVRHYFCVPEVYSGELCQPHSGWFMDRFTYIPFSPPKFAADLEAERKAEAEKARREEAIGVVTTTIEKHPSWIARQIAESVVDSLDKLRREQAKP